MGGDKEEHGGQSSGWAVTRARSISRSEGVSTTTGTESLAVSHGISWTGGTSPEASKTVGVSWSRTTAGDGGESRRIVLEELVRLLAAAPEAVTLDAVAASGQDFLLTLRLPQAMLSGVAGLAGTSEAPYLVVTKKSGTSEV